MRWAGGTKAGTQAPRLWRSQPPECKRSAGSARCGARSRATGTHTTAVGNEAKATDDGATAIGEQAEASGPDSTAIGENALANQADSSALGQDARATGVESTAIGQASRAMGINSLAIGDGAQASGNHSTAVGADTQAQAAGSVAIGRDSTGESAVAALQDQVVLGTENHTYTAPGITSGLSRSRQSGPLEVVTTDANGNLASDGGRTFEEISDNKGGIAMAIAMENPDLVGTEDFGLAVHWGHFDGANAIGIAAMGVVSRDVFMDGTGTRLSLSGSVGFTLDDEEVFGQSADESVAGRAGMQFTW